MELACAAPAKLDQSHQGPAWACEQLVGVIDFFFTQPPRPHPQKVLSFCPSSSDNMTLLVQPRIWRHNLASHLCRKLLPSIQLLLNHPLLKAMCSAVKGFQLGHENSNGSSCTTLEAVCVLSSTAPRWMSPESAVAYSSVCPVHLCSIAQWNDRAHTAVYIVT